jgi:hemoglobin
MGKTLFEKYGGFARINRVVMSFYDTLLDSEEVGPYFDNVDMDRLIDHQTKFISFLLGGPVEFPDEQLERAHATLGVTHAHFDIMKAILCDTLKRSDFELDDINVVLEAIEVRRGLIVT